MAKRKKYRTQPRIAGVSRISKPSGLLPLVEHGLKEIARTEDKSLSWVIAEIVSAYFDLDCTTGEPLKVEKPHLKIIRRRA